MAKDIKGFVKGCVVTSALCAILINPVEYVAARVGFGLLERNVGIERTYERSVSILWYCEEKGLAAKVLFNGMNRAAFGYVLDNWDPQRNLPVRFDYDNSKTWI